jgi:hypothetical protein
LASLKPESTYSANEHYDDDYNGDDDSEHSVLEEWTQLYAE